MLNWVSLLFQCDGLQQQAALMAAATAQGTFINPMAALASQMPHGALNGMANPVVPPTSGESLRVFGLTIKCSVMSCAARVLKVTSLLLFCVPPFGCCLLCDLASQNNSSNAFNVSCNMLWIKGKVFLLELIINIVYFHTLVWSLAMCVILKIQSENS
jgi:hypothetical protein